MARSGRAGDDVIDGPLADDVIGRAGSGWCENRSLIRQSSNRLNLPGYDRRLNLPGYDRRLNLEVTVY